MIGGRAPAKACSVLYAQKLNKLYVGLNQRRTEPPDAHGKQPQFCLICGNSNSRICSAPPTTSPKVHYMVSTRCEKEKSSDGAGMYDRMRSFSSVGRRFHARGAATENSPSLIRRSVLGWKRSLLLEARSEERDGMLVTSVSTDRLVM